MKKMILGLAALAMVTCSFAQTQHYGHKGNRPGMENHRGAGFRDLNLTDAQKQQTKAINEDFRQQMQQLNSNESISVKEQRDQRAVLAKAHKAKLDAVLTTDQRSQLAKAKAENAQKRAEMAGKRLDKMKEKLNLTDEQFSNIKSSQQATHNKIEAIIKDEHISREDKKQQLTALKQEMKNNMDKVLTPDQKTKLEAFKKENHDKMKDCKGRRMHRDAVK